MNENKLAVGSLALDLKRVALYLHRNSPDMAAGFEKEAWKRRNEIDLQNVPLHLVKLVQGAEHVLKMPNTEDRKAEDALMYSIILQNYAQKFL